MGLKNAAPFFDACLLSFQGYSYQKIIDKLGISRSTLLNWTRCPDWKDLQEEMRTQKREQVLEAARETHAAK